MSTKRCGELSRRPGNGDSLRSKNFSRPLIALCEPVLIETLTTVDAKNFDRAEQNLREAYPSVPVPDNVWSIVTSVQRELAAHSQHQGLSIADHLVVAMAIQLKLVVLHEDADFETVSRFVPQLREQRISVGL